MIRFYIDGVQAFPKTSNKIKVTYENPYIKDSGEYTYEVTFPMAIMENRLAFGNLHRLEVAKKKQTFEKCTLYAGNILVISGTGTVIGISNTEIKLQIVSGRSKLKYDENLSKVFIDELNYSVNSTTDQPKPTVGLWEERPTLPWVDSINTAFLGVPGVWSYNPIYNETSGAVVNDRTNEIVETTAHGTEYHAIMPGFKATAIQPNLIYVIRSVMAAAGYEVASCCLDDAPWKDIYIANVFPSWYVKDALPHWTIYYFVEELTKLFNISFVFDDEHSRVDIVSRNELINNEQVVYDHEDDFDIDYDEEGLESNESSNLYYVLDDSSERTTEETLPMSVINSFDIVEYSSVAAIEAAAEGMTTKQKCTKIFKVGEKLYTYFVEEASADANATEYTVTLKRIGVFGPLVQNEDSEDCTDVNIVPVAMRLTEMGHSFISHGDRWLPSMPNHRDGLTDDMSYDDDEGYFLSVSDAMNGTTDAIAESENKNPMYIMWQTSQSEYSLPLAFNYSDYDLVEDIDTTKVNKEDQERTLAMNYIRNKASFKMDANNAAKVVFRIDGRVPSAKNVYVFNNKKFIASKIEVEIADGKLPTMATGYFYEVI